MGSVAKAVGNAVSGVFNAAKDIVNDTIDVVVEAAKAITNFTLKVTGIEWLDQQITGGLISNTMNGVLDQIGNMAHGIVNLDWTQVRDSAFALVTTAVAIAAVVVGGFLAVMGVPLGYVFIAAGIAVLDAQYNEGELLRRTISVAAGLETAIFNTTYIEQNAYELQMILTTAAIMTAGYAGGGFLADATGLNAAISEWKTVIDGVQTVYGGYQVYAAVQSVIASQEYWKAQLEAALAYYRDLMNRQQQATDMWFDMFTKTDFINRIQAGGDLYVMGAGHEMWSRTAVAEPRYALGIIDRSDNEMDKLINNRSYMDYAGGDAFKIQ